MAVERFAENPLLTPEDLKPTQGGLEVYCTLNPAAVKIGDEYLLLVRVGEQVARQEDCVAYAAWDARSGEVKIHRIGRDDPDLSAVDARTIFYRGRTMLTSLSHLRLARSKDGRRFAFDAQPAIFPSTPYEAYGCEDPRITFIDGAYYITYTAVSGYGICVGMAVTEDFVTFQKQKLIFPPYQKDVVIFPEKVRRQYVCRHRPYKSEFNQACIWTAYSPDLLCWGQHEITLEPRAGWESERVGCGAAPIRTKDGWLEIYHASDANGRYCLGAMLSDLDHPEKVIARSPKPVMEPSADYELTGVYGHCVFTNGMIVQNDGTLLIYYGAADRICAGATTSVDEMVEAALKGRVTT